MTNRSFNELVLVNFPDLTVRRDIKHPQLFVMLNKNGEMFDENMSSLSAKQTWEIAHRLMLRGELKPTWLEEHEKSMKEAHESLIEAKKDPNWKPSITDQEIDALVDGVLSKHGFS